MKKNKILMILSIALMLIIPTSFFIIKNDQGEKISAQAVSNNEDHTKKELIGYEQKYHMNLAIIYGDDSYLPTFQHLKQSNLASFSLDSVHINEMDTIDLKKYDVIYVNSSSLMNTDEKRKGIIKNKIEDFTKNGGYTLLESEIANVFPTNFTGISSINEVNILKTELELYSDIDKNYIGVQNLYNMFYSDYKTHINRDLYVNILDLYSAKPIVGSESEALVAIKTYEEGQVITLSNFLPNYEEYITSYDFRYRDEQNNYFQFFYSTGNQQIINELLSYISKDKYGFSIKKVTGNYGRPAMAWQNHYEVLSAIGKKEIVDWVDLLKKNNQVPTVSLVRGSYEWGEWYGTINYHYNIGDENNPYFIGEELNSFYSSGYTFKNKERENITFGQYPKQNSYYQDVEYNFRTYPFFVDYNNNSKVDLVVGKNNGEIVLLKNQSKDSVPQFHYLKHLKYSNNERINVGKNATPILVDYNNNGKLDIIVGNEEGYLFLIERKNENYKYKKHLYTISHKKIKVNQDATPFIADINRNGILDLVIGDRNGNVHFYEGINTDNHKLEFKDPIKLEDEMGIIDVGSYSSPHIVDYNNNGYMDMLIGDSLGNIHIYLSKGHMNFEYHGLIPSERKNIYGENTIYSGKSVVPFMVDLNSNGKKDLVTGQLSFALVYDISEDHFPYKHELEETIEYLKDNHIPIIPHLYSHSYKDDQLEKKEIQYHKKAFEKLNIPWDYTGTDQHTWRVNFEYPRQTFENQIKHNIYYNFGFRTPNCPSDPVFGRDYIWPNIFMFADKEEIEPLVMSTPAPFLNFYSGVYENLASMDLPLLFFEHIEYKIRDSLSQGLIDMIDEINKIRLEKNYIFMTQNQIAKAFINNFYTDYNIYIKDNHLKIEADLSEVPAELVKEFINTGGLKIELGEKYLHQKINTDSILNYRQGNDLYLGIKDTTSITIDNEKKDREIKIISSNTPIEINENNEGMDIKMNTQGMKQIKLKSNKDIKIIGDDIEVIKDNNVYTITTWGSEKTIKIREP